MMLAGMPGSTGVFSAVHLESKKCTPFSKVQSRQCWLGLRGCLVLWSFRHGAGVGAIAHSAPFRPNACSASPKTTQEHSLQWRAKEMISSCMFCFVFVGSVTQLCLTLCDPMGCSLSGSELCAWDFPGKNIGVGCHFLLQGIFLIQGSNLLLLHWQVDSLPLSHLGSPL